MKIISIKRRNGDVYEVKVDDDQYDELMQYTWYVLIDASGTPYAKRSERDGARNRHVAMARQLLGLERGDPRQADHINHDTLDNQRANLRVVAPRENQLNRRKHGHNGRAPSSSYRGVCYNKRDRKWMARFQAVGRSIYLGYFDNEIDAALAYDAAVIQHDLQDFAQLNFPAVSRLVNPEQLSVA